eukprot:5472873-Amphidinium_carterae.1
MMSIFHREDSSENVLVGLQSLQSTLVHIASCQLERQQGRLWRLLEVWPEARVLHTLQLLFMAQRLEGFKT